MTLTKLTVRQNQLDYVGYFARPAFDLWNDVGRVLSALHEAFAPLGMQIGALSVTPGQPTDLSVRALMGNRGVFTFRLDRLTWQLSGFTDEDLNGAAEVLTRGTGWLEGRFQSHSVSYQAHSTLERSNANDFLTSLGARTLKMGGDGSTGLIFHFQLGKPAGDVHFTLDRSLMIPDGLYSSMAYVGAMEAVEYSDALQSLRTTFDNSLVAVGLERER